MLSLLLLLTAVPSDEGSAVLILCDPARFRLTVMAEESPGSTGVYPVRRRIPIATLETTSPGPQGYARYRRPLVRWEQCGPYAIRLEGDSFNSDREGRDGASDSFAWMTIVTDRVRLYPIDGTEAVRLGACPRDIVVCDSGWIERLDLKPADDRIEATEQIATTLAYDVDPRSDTRRHRTIRLDQQMELWPTDPHRYDDQGRIRSLP